MNWLSTVLNRLNEKNCVTLLALTFIVLAALIATVPYDPSADLADATTNDIWIEHYSEGIYHIPWSEWTNNHTQSVVVEYQGEYVVVNEKGPGHVMAMVPFRAIGAEWLFAYTMAGLAVLGTFMLGKRLFSWPVGFIAAMLVMFNLTVVVMWHRYYWTDASTMHFLIFSVWLFVEGIYRYNGGSLVTLGEVQASWKERALGLGLGLLAGFFFGMSVSTRYPTALLIVIFPIFILGFYITKIWPDLRKKDILPAIKRSMPAILHLGVFAIGLLIVLVPLMQYNTAYFGGPFNSGYDATLVIKFDPDIGIEARNTSTVWTGDFFSYTSIAVGNLFKLAPMFLSRMPALIFLPIGLYCLRKKKVEMAMLCAWIGINFYTYLSLDWVDMYARTDLMPWEPRYWMPSLPAIAIVAGLGIYRLSGWLATRVARKQDFREIDTRGFKVIFSGAIAGALILCSAVPAIGYLQNPEDPEETHIPPSQQAILVTTDQLLANPLEYVGKAVLLNDAAVTGKSFSMIDVQSVGSVNTASIAVRFVDYPQETLPEYSVGDHVVVRGVFSKASTPPDAPPIYFLGVMYGTEDYTRLLP